MERYGPETYGDRVADLYDDWYQGLLSTSESVELLAELAGAGPVLELVVEAQLPDPTLFREQQSLRVQRVTVDSVVLVASRFDLTTQRMESQQVQIGQEGMRLVPGILRWAWPSELDLMARLAGLRLRERWGGWRREPFTASSRWHVSVYELPR